jgi:hypothetical protein
MKRSTWALITLGGVALLLLILGLVLLLNARQAAEDVDLGVGNLDEVQQLNLEELYSAEAEDYVLSVATCKGNGTNGSVDGTVRNASAEPRQFVVEVAFSEASGKLLGEGSVLSEPLTPEESADFSIEVPLTPFSTELRCAVTVPRPGSATKKPG